MRNDQFGAHVSEAPSLGYRDQTSAPIYSR
jgi:hypothetical protein